MPNLRQILELKNKYSNLNPTEVEVNKYLAKSLLHNARKKKLLLFGEEVLWEGFDQTSLPPKIIKYFESNVKENVVLLFIDIVSFSKITEDKTSDFISKYLNDYYKRVFQIIFKYDGQIEKLMGDGIICVFGKPFMDNSQSELLYAAENCADELIKVFKGTNKEVKIALHSGEISYFKTPTTIYEEYTMIGKPLTELFRLESESVDNAINFYKNSEYDKYYTLKNKIKLLPLCNTHEKPIVLKGVGYKYIKYREI